MLYGPGMQQSLDMLVNDPGLYFIQSKMVYTYDAAESVTHTVQLVSYQTHGTSYCFIAGDAADTRIIIIQ